jgi:hypothetical protein
MLIDYLPYLFSEVYLDQDLLEIALDRMREEEEHYDPEVISWGHPIGRTGMNG